MKKNHHFLLPMSIIFGLTAFGSAAFSSSDSLKEEDFYTMGFSFTKGAPDPEEGPQENPEIFSAVDSAPGKGVRPTHQGALTTDVSDKVLAERTAVIASLPEDLVLQHNLRALATGDEVPFEKAVASAYQDLDEQRAQTQGKQAEQKGKGQKDSFEDLCEALVTSSSTTEAVKEYSQAHQVEPSKTREDSSSSDEDFFECDPQGEGGSPLLRKRLSDSTSSFFIEEGVGGEQQDPVWGNGGFPPEGRTSSFLSGYMPPLFPLHRRWEEKVALGISFVFSMTLIAVASWRVFHAEVS